MYNVLVCDDEKDIVSALQIYLKRKKETTIMKKRVLAVILGAVMTMSLAACGSSDAGKRPGSQRNEGLRNRKNPEDG